MSLAEIKEHGTQKADFYPTGISNIVRCADGFKMSVVAGPGAYCSPRPKPIVGLTGNYTAAEVGFPSERPEPWDIWREFAENADDPTATVYGWVPFEVIEALAALHGGERL
ncbi:MAG: hypothetical protein ACRDT9_03960 [Agromyces sp.]